MSYVAAACELGSISKASTRLGVSQPSLTRQIRALEEDLGTALILRSAQGVKPTLAGTALINQYERIRTEVRRVADVVHSAVNGRETVRIALSPGLPSVWLRSLLDRLNGGTRRIDPVLVDLASPEIEQALTRHTIDVGFMHYAPHALSAHRLFDQQLGVALRPTSERYRSATMIRDLEGARLLAHSSWEVSGQMSSADHLNQSLGVNVSIRYRRFTEHVELFCESVEADGVILTEATAGMMLRSWKWMPLDSAPVDPLMLTTYAVFKAPATPGVDRILDAMRTL